MRNKIPNNLIKATVGITVVVAAYAAGAGIIPAVFSPQMQTDSVALAKPLETPTVEARLVETHTIEYIEETIIETEYVDVIKEVPRKLRNFESLEELEQWVNNEIKTTTLRFSTEEQVIDCDDFAFEMQQKALADGYIVSFQIISRAEYNELFATLLPEGQSLHAINLAIIGNSIFYVEPQTGEVVHAAYLD